jgi:hypothetical protein
MASDHRSEATDDDRVDVYVDVDGGRLEERQITYSASWLKVSRSPSGGRAGWTPAAVRVCAHVF